MSWDVDSVSPRDMPCVMRQEPHGLSAEEITSFADEFARTEKLVSQGVAEIILSDLEILDIVKFLLILVTKGHFHRVQNFGHCRVFGNFSY